MKKIYALFLLLFAVLSGKSQGKYYINSNIGQPWGQNTNITSMNTVFGVGTWTQAVFESVNINAITQPSVCFIFLEGGDNNANALNTFLSTNLIALQNWVFNGGKLFINSAPNQGGNINFGFGGVTLTYPGASSTSTPALGMDNHAIYLGPAVPTGTSFTGGSYSHASINNGTTVPIMMGTSGPLLTERFWGQGRVMFGGMTTTNFHNPAPNATNIRNNMLSLMGGCCGANATIAVVASSVGICAGQSVTLTASGATGGTYTTYPGNLTGSVVVVSPTVSTNYNVVGTPTSGCAGGQTIRIVVNTGTPTVNITGGNTLVCSANTVNLLATGAVNYTWSNGVQTASNPVTQTVNTTYTVIGTNGCATATAATNVSVNPSPNMALTGNTLICGTGTNVLTASGANTYSWNTGANTSSVSLSPTITTNYTVVGTNTLGNCTASLTTTMVVSSNPSVAITGGTAVVCGGAAVTLTASGASTYSWSNGTNSAIAVVNPTANTTYTVVGTNTAGCSGSAVKAITVTAAPSLSIAGTNTICSGSSATLTVSGADSFTWNTGANTGSVVVSPTVTTTYTASGTSTTSGCSSSIQHTLTVIVCTSVDAQSLAKVSFQVIPNPNNGEFEVNFNTLSGTKTVDVLDITGKVLHSEKTEQSSLQMNLNRLPEGIYLIKVSNQQQTGYLKMTKN